MATHPLGMTLVFLDHPLGFLRLPLVVRRLGLVVLLGCSPFLLFHLTLGLAYGPRLRRCTPAEQQKQYQQEGNQLGCFLHDN